VVNLGTMRSAEQRREELKAVYREASGCTRCTQLAATRQTVVFGSGNADADLMFVGEAPGANEDKQGVPFVGQAGKLLDQLLGEIGLTRPDVFVVNVLKCLRYNAPGSSRSVTPERSCRSTRMGIWSHGA
jgi:uracil-DNA glycosylase